MTKKLNERLNTSAPAYIDLTKEENDKTPYSKTLCKEKSICFKEPKKEYSVTFTNKINSSLGSNHIAYELYNEGDQMCRICHSETGILISPCVCHGSMGCMHDECLMEWIKHSGNSVCELCGKKYKAEKKLIWNITKWSTPQISGLVYFKVMVLILNIFLLRNCINILKGNNFVKRIFKMSLFPTSKDMIAIFVIILSIVLMLRILGYFLIEIVEYLNKQKVYKFIDYKGKENIQK
uniref:RING-CH-type domain-containing protein n=1 Tax=Parastrongyloides trichosuri TaxID=131310 RepID=A0A0N4ZA32_PARTI